MNIRLMQESVEICARFAQEMGINVWMRQGRLPVPGAHARRRARRMETQRRAAEPLRRAHADDLARARRGDGARARRRRRASSAPATTRPTASCSRGRSCGATRAPPPSAASRSTRRRRSPRSSAAAAAASSLDTPAGSVRARAGRLTRPAPGRRRSRAWWASTLPNSPAAPRDPVDRAAQAVPEADGVGARDRPVLLAVAARRDGRRHHRCPSRRRRRPGAAWARGWRSSTAIARALVELMPRLGDVKVVRQWAGPLRPVAPTATRSSASCPACPASTSCCGFVGHGFMMAPVVARHYAAAPAGRRAPPALRRLAPRSLRRRPPRARGGGEEMFIG